VQPAQGEIEMAIENTDQAIKPQMTEEQKEQAEKLIAAQPKFIKKVAKENKARRQERRRVPDSCKPPSPSPWPSPRGRDI